MRCLILSDIHANQPALDAVLQDAEGHYDSIACLGDLVGYGASPNSIVEWARQSVTHLVRGNHDRACIGDRNIEGFGGAAQLAAMWTLRQLEAANAEFLRSLPAGPLETDGFALMHGSPRDEDEYVFERFEAIRVFPFLPAEVCFFGHTHCQGAFGLRHGKVWELAMPDVEESERAHRLEPDSYYLVNPGSVGQPRDRDPRAGYALYDTRDRVVYFRRVAYDVALAQAGIRAAGLPGYLADRLQVGR